MNSKQIKQMLTVAVVAAALIAATAGDVLARQGRGFAPARGEREAMEPGQMRLERMTARLDLSAEQQEAIAGHQAAAREKNLELRKQMMRLRHELQGAMLEDRPEERTVVQLTERIGKLRTDLQVNRAKLELAIMGELTDAQRDEMMLMRRPGGRFDRGGPRGWCDGPGFRASGAREDGYGDGPQRPRRRPGRF